LNYSDEQLNDAYAALTRLYTALRGCDSLDAAIDADYKARFELAMDDDFNTPVAVSVLFDLARELNRAKETNQEKTRVLAATLKYLGGLLGILQDDPEGFLKAALDSDELTDAIIEQQIRARLEAKKAKNWAWPIKSAIH